MKIKEEVREEIPDLSRITCDPCNIAFIAESDYFAHVKETHLKFERNMVPSAPSAPPPTPAVNPFNQVNQHTFPLPNLTYLSGEKSVFEYDMQMKRTNLPKVKVFNCPECKRTFQHEKNLKNHIKSKHEKAGGKTFNCEECGKEYMHKHNLEEHVIVHHRNQRFTCTHCENVYSSKKTLHIHIKAKHQGKTFNCNQCDAKYFYNHELQQHQRSKHQGVVYQCDQCNDAFVHKQSLKNHIRNVHQKIRDKKCELCGMTFALHSGLYMHMKRKHEAEWTAKRAALAAARNALKAGLEVDVIPRGVHQTVPIVQATSAAQNTQMLSPYSMEASTTVAPASSMASSAPVNPTSQLPPPPAMAALTQVAPASQCPQTSATAASSQAAQWRPTLTPMASLVPMAPSPSLESFSQTYSMASFTPMVPIAPTF